MVQGSHVGTTEGSRLAVSPRYLKPGGTGERGVNSSKENKRILQNLMTHQWTEKGQCSWGAGQSEDTEDTVEKCKEHNTPWVGICPSCEASIRCLATWKMKKGEQVEGQGIPTIHLGRHWPCISWCYLSQWESRSPDQVMPGGTRPLLKVCSLFVCLLAWPNFLPYFNRKNIQGLL